MFRLSLALFPVGSLRRRPAIGIRASKGETPTEDLLFNIEVNLSTEEKDYPGARRRGLRWRFLPRQAGADAYTGAVDDDIRDTHLQCRLKDHPSAQVWK